MAKRLEARINSKALIWAREVIGMPLEVAASKIGVNIQRLQAFEEGELYPTINQLRTIGRVYRKPAPFFYLTTLPEKPERLSDFRLLPDSESEQCPELIDAVNRVRERHDDAMELITMLEYEIPKFELSADRNTSPLRLASSIRNLLGVSFDTQFNWREPYTALNSWIAAIEKVGILVSQFSDVPIEEARGFSILDTYLPIIAINGKDWPRAKIFTLFHELAHLALGKTGLCDLHDEVHNQGWIEPYCNQVAGEVLVPSRSILSNEIVKRHNSTNWSEEELSELGKQYSVSKEVILRRLLKLGKTTNSFYQRMRQHFAEILENERSQRSGFLQYYRRVLRDNGYAYSKLVLDAYKHEYISSLDASRLFGGVKFKHIENIEYVL